MLANGHSESRTREEPLGHGIDALRSARVERILAVVPARGGSKRLPRKNVRLLGGIPLIVWSINTAINADFFCDVLLTTDDEEIALIGRDAGALVPWLRPAELASDTAPSEAVLLHALDWYESEHGLVDAVALLQPTSPLRRIDSLKRALNLFLAQPESGRRKSVVSVSRSSIVPEWCFRICDHDNKLRPVLGWEGLTKRSQDLEDSYQLNGSVYITPSSVIRAGEPLVSPGSIGIVMDTAEEAVDIDDETDWRLAESFLSKLKSAHNLQDGSY